MPLYTSFEPIAYAVTHDHTRLLRQPIMHVLCAQRRWKNGINTSSNLRTTIAVLHRSSAPSQLFERHSRNPQHYEVCRKYPKSIFEFLFLNLKRNILNRKPYKQIFLTRALKKYITKFQN